jgi:hypothetical protein
MLDSLGGEIYECLNSARPLPLCPVTSASELGYVYFTPQLGHHILLMNAHRESRCIVR